MAAVALRVRYRCAGQAESGCDGYIDHLTLNYAINPIFLDGVRSSRDICISHSLTTVRTSIFNGLMNIENIQHELTRQIFVVSLSVNKETQRACQSFSNILLVM